MKELIKVFKALSDGTRLRILNLLLKRECCVCEVVQALGISQTRASRNLTQLYEAGLLEQRREGLWAIYRLSEPALADYRGLIIRAVEQALLGSELAAADIHRLAKSSRRRPASNTADVINQLGQTARGQHGTQSAS